MVENRLGFDENSLVQEGRRLLCRRQKALMQEALMQEAEGSKERKLIQSAFSPLSTG